VAGEAELESFKNNPTVVLSPLGRYLEEACCSAEDHIISRQEEGKDNKKKMEEARQNLKNFAFRKGRRRVVTKEYLLYREKGKCRRCRN
jgi:hypothetical protein